MANNGAAMANSRCCIMYELIFFERTVYTRVVLETLEIHERNVKFVAFYKVS